MPVLDLSRFIIANKADCYRLLQALTRDGAWEAWLLYMLRAVEDRAYWTTAKIGAIRALAIHTSDHVRREAPKICRRELVDIVFEQSYCGIANPKWARFAGRQAASRHLKVLVSIGVLREQAAGRDKLFVHAKVMTLLRPDDHRFDPYRNGMHGWRIEPHDRFGGRRGTAGVTAKSRRAASHVSVGSFHTLSEARVRHCAHAAPMAQLLARAFTTSLTRPDC